MSGTALALALLIADPVTLGAPPAPPAQPEDSEVLQGEADGYERMTVDVALEGKGPYRFLIDTGSQRTVVSTALAGRLGLAVGPQVRVIGMAGENNVATAQLDTLGIGKRELYNLVVPLLEHEHIGADGILGTDSLQHQRVLLDFDSNTIAIGDPHKLGGRAGYEITVRARKRSGRLIVTNARIDGIPVDVVIDTGASGTVGNLALQKAMRDRPAFNTTLLSVTGHNLSAQVGLARNLKINDLTVTNVLIAFADAPAFRELDLRKRPAIFLGMRELRVFKRVAIDFNSRSILFDLPQ
ncbi:aspartyl protease family protein [Novosphingobium mangrovi (ex Huang et al. 2023)]|uniref:Aspartyl protease family protein n=1 Tax=Novosphingobium mangrovi (ex Huang et al. 2023) TaxID=2976432 RepID=A0ABT2I5N6_9SPHN|nr:aspartyl protease family protein [Novosphingobium mangrovi (ex Huang et al. 2023)]MCT2400130.1 aspartyl protease family protein [Novosphingobium mangrovi (ex Huang et al. 2023)]